VPRAADRVVRGKRGEPVAEYLDTSVATVGDIHVAAGVDGQRVWRFHLARLRAPRSHRCDKPAAPVKLGDARIAFAVDDEDVRGAIPCNVQRVIQVGPPKRRDGRRRVKGK